MTSYARVLTAAPSVSTGLPEKAPAVTNSNPEMDDDLWTGWGMLREW